MIAHLKNLGVTTIELLPIHAFVDDRMLVEKKLVNYWGYNHAVVSSRRSRATPRTIRSTRSGPRWHGCMMPASR